MADRSLTLFEVHLHDGLSFSATNTAPAIGGDDGEQESEATGTDIEIEDTGSDEQTESSGTPTGLAVLIGLVLVAGLAVAARKLMGDEDLEELEELDDLAAEA